MASAGGDLDVDDDKARRRAERDMIVSYHRAQLRSLLDRVRQDFDRLDAGEIDEFEMDEVIHRYSRSAKELWKFCGYGGTRLDWAVHSLDYARSCGSEPDWWERGRPRGRD